MFLMFEKMLPIEFDSCGFDLDTFLVQLIQLCSSIHVSSNAHQIILQKNKCLIKTYVQSSFLEKLEKISSIKKSSPR